jgi:hypothetical protein
VRRDPAVDDPSTIKMSKAERDELSHRLKTNSLTAEDRALLDRVLKAMLWMTSQLEAGRLGMGRLKRLLFGEKTESRKNLLGNHGRSGSSPTDPTSNSSGTKAGGDGSAEPKPGHGRNSHGSYPGAERVFCPHPTLRSGDLCPQCEKGRLHDAVDNGVFVRFEGNPPITVTVYETEKLRCALCGAVSEAPLPDGVKAHRWDETAKSMAALLRYGFGVPHFRQEKLQQALGMRIADSTLQEKSEEVADCGYPLYRELERLAATGDTLNLDDTRCRILELIRENKKLNPDKDRVGIFTTALVARNGEHEISFFWSGRRHAGENLERLMKQRPEGMPLPTLMVDGSSRNVPENLKAILANCLTHGRRQFIGLETSFPAEIAHVINEIACIYRNDAVTKERAMNAEERLRYHQEHSEPVIDELRLWCRDQIESKKTEPNSGLGKAIHYLEKRWTELTVFLRVPGAPLSNDIVERLIKRCVLHRKNSLFYKTLQGAAVGDVLMTLIHTAIAAGKNPFEYLTVLQLHRSAVVKAPADWLPWTYEASATALPPQ